jgi:hypothetical protein
MRLPIVSRAVGFSRALLELVRIDERRRQLEGVDAEGLLDDSSDLAESGAASACVARASGCRSALVRVLQRAQLGATVVRARASLNSSASTSEVGSGGSELSVGRSRPWCRRSRP